MPLVRNINPLGKIGVKVLDPSGFILNWMLVAMINEAAYVLMCSMPTMRKIDLMMKLRANFLKGLLNLMTTRGLTLSFRISKYYIGSSN